MMEQSQETTDSSTVEAEEVRMPGEKKDEKQVAEDLSWTMTIAGILGIFGFLYLFLIGLGLMGDAFKTLGGRGAGKLFTSVDNPIAGLMVGVLATVLVQSSSTSTSIIVGLVSSEQINVQNAIPMIMGANIGTSVTNTIVSMGQIMNRLDLERAFAGATVHDMFNMLTVITLLPIEMITRAISGEGGLLYWISKGLTQAFVGAKRPGELFPSPIKVITKPITKFIIRNNKYVIKALSLDRPVAVPLAAGQYKTELCTREASRRLEASPSDSYYIDEEEEEEEEPDEQPEEFHEDVRSLLSSRRLAEKPECSHFYCISDVLSKNLKKVNKKAYKKQMIKCGDYVLVEEPCGPKEACYLNAGDYYRKYIDEGRIVKGGIVKGAGDSGGGIIALILALVILCIGLFGLVQCLQMLLIRKARKVIARATMLNDYLAMVVGTGLTILVQSSSVVTSALTPLCGMGVITLEKMLPLTLGANIGTTVTALIAALATAKFNPLQIALCHLIFNIIGICLWYPVPFMRRFPLGAARLMGLYASFWRALPFTYIMFTFVAVPAALLGLSLLYGVSLAAGIALTVLLIGLVAAFGYWWNCLGGCYNIVSKEQRIQRFGEMEHSHQQITGGHAAEPRVSSSRSLGDQNLSSA